MSRQLSADIIAGGNELRQKTAERIESKRGNRRSYGFFQRKNKETKEEKEDAQKELKAELVMTEHQISQEELFQKYGTDPVQGMTDENAAKRLQEDGPNRLTPPKQKPEWLKLVETQTGFFSVLLWVGAILCFLGFGLKGDKENLYLGIVLALVVSLTGVFSYFQEAKSSNLMNSFKEMMPTRTTIVRSGKTGVIGAIDLVCGDIIKLKGGDKVPADVRIIECSDDMKVDNASLTGESEAVKREPACTHKNPLETRNLAFFGTLVPSGSATCVVVNTGDQTVMGRIASLTLQTENVETPIAKEIEHFVLIVSAVAITLGLSFFIIGAILQTDWLTNLVFMIGIIVANVPEGLLATVTVCLTLTAKRMHSKSVLVKNLEGVETLGSTSCICSDKTGTLTQNVMTVAHLVYDLQIWDVESTMAAANFNDQDPSFTALQRCATLCNTASWDVRSQVQCDEDGNPKNDGSMVPFTQEVELGDGTTEKRIMWRPIGDASESAMIKFCQSKRDIIEYREAFPLNPKGKIPFNSANKYQVHVNWDEEGKQWIDLLKGAPERVTERCTTILINGEEVPLTEEHKTRIADLQLQLSRRGMRVLGFSEKKLDRATYPKEYKFDAENVNFPIGESEKQFQEKVDMAKEAGADPPNERQKEGLCYIGMMALIDPPRPQVPGAVAKCKTAGIKVIMVTGDHPETAKAISKKVGIIWGETGDDISLRNEEYGLKKGDAGWDDPDLAPAIVVPGWDISVDTPPEVWDDILSHSQVVFARTSPQQKLIIVENCQKRRHVVAVTGDGVNDSPALKKADIGVAMGIMGTDVSKEAADMILLDDNFASIVSGVEEGRLIFDNLKKSIAYTLSSNIPEISPFLAFIVVQIPLPLSTVLILCVDLGTDMVPAISMAWENPEADIMGRNPRDADVDRLVTKKLVSFAYLQIGVIQALSGFYTYITVLNDYGFSPQVLPGLGAVDNWSKQTLTCQLTGGGWRDFRGFSCPCFEDAANAPTICGGLSGVEWWETKAKRNLVIQRCQQFGFVFWDQDTQLSYVDGGVAKQDVEGYVEECAYPVRHLRNDVEDPPNDFNPLDSTTYHRENGELYIGAQSVGLPTKQSKAALVMPQGKTCPEGKKCPYYYEYLPYRSVMSPFFEKKWVAHSVTDDDTLGLGESVDTTILFQYQPIGEWNIFESSLAIFNVTMGHISDVVDHSIEKNNGFAITEELYENAWLDQSDNVPWLSRNMMEDSYFEAMINTICETVTCDAAEIAETVTQLQYRRCGNAPGASKDNEHNWGSLRSDDATSYKCLENEIDELIMLNVASRNMQKEALHHAQSASFIGIIVVQWADLVICKTRWLSIRQQGMQNPVMNFALVFELILGALLCYIGPIGTGLGTRNLRITHWFCAMPFSCTIFMYDEIRKYFMRETSSITTNKVTGRSVRNPGWLERFTYY